MDRPTLLNQLFGEHAQKLPHEGDCAQAWGPPEPDDDEHDDDEDDWEDDEGSFPMAPAAPALVLFIDDTDITPAFVAQHLGDFLMDMPQLTGRYWDGKAEFSLSEPGPKVWFFIEFQTTDPDEHAAAAIGAIFTLDDGKVALVLLGAPQTFEEITREGELAHAEEIRSLLGVTKLPPTTSERELWFM